ncbi:MAG TPA: hypothetical protein VIP77_16115 [Jiangellaceae bacterium]
MKTALRKRGSERREVQRTVSALMDEAPAWRDWFAWQLRLLDLEYDPGHWITMESIR